MADLTLAESRALTAATSDSVHLLSLDAAWTDTARAASEQVRSAQQPTAPAVSDAANITGLGQDMTTLLGRMDSHARTIGGLAAAHHDTLTQAFDALLSGPALEPHTRDELRDYLSRRGGVAGLIASVSELGASVPGETTALRAQVSDLAAGGSVAGDLSQHFRCGLAQNLIVGGALAIPSGVVAALGVAVGTAAILATTGVAAVGLILLGLWWAHHLHC